ncbi:uncharacterized protein [Phyllobates terribilis]|uniref:uncharacterized protein isoform X2 n=1 Tax=Phyllobates terribilis TaxID=111132 RepID=UPI003CCB0033
MTPSILSCAALKTGRINPNGGKESTIPTLFFWGGLFSQCSLCGNDLVPRFSRKKNNTSSDKEDSGCLNFIRKQKNRALAENQVAPLEKTSQRRTDSPEPPQSAQSEFSHGKSSSFEEKMCQMRRTMKRKPPRPVKVGIFSRSAESEYDWLKRMLESESFVKSVRPYYISNNGLPEFSGNVSRCDFGILYHTQNRGRVNLTDITDSLYDEELKELFAKLEKKNVIVVIDDLKDSSEERKNEILKEQPKLKSLATDVFLFTGDEKKVTEEK